MTHVHKLGLGVAGQHLRRDDPVLDQHTIAVRRKISRTARHPQTLTFREICDGSELLRGQGHLVAQA
jgi:hypothetical protein